MWWCGADGWTQILVGFSSLSGSVMRSESCQLLEPHTGEGKTMGIEILMCGSKQQNVPVPLAGKGGFHFLVFHNGESQEFSLLEGNSCRDAVKILVQNLPVHHSCLKCFVM